MSTHKVEVVRVGPVEKHPNADKLGLFQVWGYTCVTALDGGHKEGDLVAFIEPDYVVPLDRPEFSFLTDSRIRARRLRGIWSQGLCVPAPEGAAEGDDVMAQLGIIRYEPKVRYTRYGGIKGESLDAEKAHESLRWLPKYDLENLRKFHYVFEPGELVYASEKIHGCVPANARITMADGTQRALNHVKVGDYVLGVDAEGRAVATRVLQKFDNGKAAEGWLRITGQRRATGRGSSKFALICTPNHEVWCANEQTYKEARSLRAGDTVTAVRTDMALSPLQHSVLLGKLLGDGSLAVCVNTAAVSWGHSVADAGYMDWTAKALGTLAGSRDTGTSGYGTQMLRQRSVGSALVAAAFGDMLQEGRKGVPDWVGDKLDPIALAFWYMDDGSLQHSAGQEDRASFAVCSFTEQECAVLQRGLRRLGMDSVYSVSEGKDSRLALNATNAERLFLLVAPYVPPCMQRKLPERYRGGAGWLPQSGAAEFRQTLVTLTVDDIAVYAAASKRYDLETETHNYFAYGIRVHNSNARYAWRDGRMWLGSRTQWKKPEDNSWWRMALETNPWIETWCSANPDCVLYGEIYGMQDLQYGVPDGEVHFRAFDVMHGNSFMNVRDFCASVLPEHRAPGSYCTFDMEKLAELSRQNSWVYPKHIAEGIVVRPLEERVHRNVGRVALKLVSDKYLERAK